MFPNKLYLRICIIFLIFSLFSNLALASTPALDVKVIEYVSEIVAYDQTYSDGNSVQSDAFGEDGENNTGVSRTNVVLQEMAIRGIVNITNTETIGSTTLTSINVTLYQTQNVTGFELLSGPDYLFYNLSSGESPDSANISIFIGELAVGDSAIFNFSVNGSGTVGEPVNVTEEYSSWRVLTGRSVNVTLNITNSLTKNIPMYDLQIIKTPQGYNSIHNTPVYFNYTDLNGEDDSNASIQMSGGRSILTWNVSNKTLAQGQTRQVYFNSWAPQNLSRNLSQSQDWGSWMSMGNLSASFKFNGSLTGIYIYDIKASTSDLDLAVSKDRLNETNWEARVNLSNTATSPLDYNVSSLTIWATQYQEYENPADTSVWVTGTNTTAFDYLSVITPYANATWDAGFNLSGGSANHSYYINFNYSLVPIVWSDLTFYVYDDGNQITRINMTENEPEGYLFVEEIYVLLGGYLVKVTKDIYPYDLSPAINNSYIINITVENIGTEETPELVSMFDLVPKDFLPLTTLDALATYRNITTPNAGESVLEVTNYDGNFLNLPGAVSSGTVLGYNDTGEISSGPYQGFWGYHLDLNRLNATSNGNGVYDASNADKEIGMTYKITGNTTLSRIDNAYIVGVDPVRLEGANPSKNVNSNLNIASSSVEYFIIIASLVVSVLILSSGVLVFKKK